MLPPEQITQIKQQLISQLEQSNVPNKEEIKKSIGLMNPEQLEEFLKQNNLIKNNGEPSQQQCIFCSIVSGDAQSYKIDENNDAIAILEINPISKAHALIIPKQHLSSSKELPKTVLALAEKISKKIKTKLKPKDMTITPSNLFGHEIINVLPVYKNENINSQRKQAKPEELENLQKLLETKPKPKTVKKPRTKKINEKLWLPKRIP